MQIDIVQTAIGPVLYSKKDAEGIMVGECCWVNVRHALFEEPYDFSIKVRLESLSPGHNGAEASLADRTDSCLDGKSPALLWYRCSARRAE